MQIFNPFTMGKMEKGFVGTGEVTAMTKTEVADAVYQGMMRYQKTQGALAAAFLLSVIVVYGCFYATWKILKNNEER